MTLAPGSRLGSYEIVSAIGAGGMGEVFRARDPKLGRDVAIKVLPAALANDAERVARFRREAQLLGALHHPNVASIFGLEESDGTVSLVMELVEGEDLAQRITRGAIPIDEATAIARQIAEGLEAAHEKGIVHRDLKPANVKLGRDGAVKILDFGLAKALEGFDAAASGPTRSQSPTVSPQETSAGMILGTAAYMSPEQARGQAVDRRADIWSFGVVLFEMLTGARLFAARTMSDTLAAVLRQEVDLGSLPPATPQPVKSLLARCLERDPKLRLRDIGEARIVLGGTLASAAPAPPGTAPAAPRRPTVALAALAALALAAAGLWVGTRLAPAPRPHPVVRTTYPMGAGTGLAIQRRLVAISPDGRTLAGVVGSLATGSFVQVRRLAELEARRVAGSEGARSVFFSPDSRFVGFSTDTALRKVAIDSNEVVTVADIGTTLNSGPFGIAWGDDGRIYFGALDGIRAVPESGGSSRVVVAGASLSHPRVLPGSRWLLYARGQHAITFAPNGQIVLRSLADGVETALTTGTSPAFLPGGILLVARADGLFAAPLSLRGRRLTREPALVVGQVALAGSAAQFDVSETGTLVHVPGSTREEWVCNLARVDASGRGRLLSRVPRQFSELRVAPDGLRVALHVQDADNDVWTYDPVRDAMTRLTFEPGEDETPVWSPDGRWIAFAATRGQDRCVIRRRADGSGGEEVLWRLAEHAHVSDWSPDGRSLLVDVYRTTRRTDIVRLDLLPKPEPHDLVSSPFDESSGRVSPDGRWFAYRSNESGRDEIYLQPFPGGGGKVPISTGGGLQPVWSRDGRSLFFRSEADVAVARLGGASAPAFQAPVPLFRDRFVRPQGPAHTTYDVFPDGSFLFLEPVASPNPAAESRSVVATFHWLENLDLSSRGAP